MEVNHYYSPLRYPGGKASLKDFLVQVLTTNNLIEGVYAEPFAGGAGAALDLLMQEYVSEIALNDKDPFIYLFWKSVIENNDELIKLIRDTPVTLDEWERRKAILIDSKRQQEISQVELGFTAFFLNRSNHSGILKANPIGGRKQTGKWKIDARYNKDELIKRIYRIGFYNESIKVYNLDSLAFLRKLKCAYTSSLDKLFVYLDPPYYVNGKDLYRHFFQPNDHLALSKYIQSQNDYKWMISYDDHPFIHQIYKEIKKNIIEFNYFANRTKVGRELIISSNACELPSKFNHYSREKIITEDDSFIYSQAQVI